MIERNSENKIYFFHRNINLELSLLVLIFSFNCKKEYPDRNTKKKIVLAES